MGAPDLVAALAPQSERRCAEQGSQALLPLLALAGKGIAAGLSFIASGRGKKYLSLLQRRQETAGQRAKRYEVKYHRARDPEVKARWKRRWEKAKAKADDAALTRKLAESGIVGDIPVLEYKKNLLALEWEDKATSPERKKEIEKRVMRIDKRLTKLKRHAMALAAVMPASEGEAGAGAQDKTGGVAPGVPRVEITRPDPRTVPPGVGDAGSGRWARRLAGNQRRGRGILGKVDRAMVSGIGGLSFDVLSPPGAGRLVRLPFYPETPANSWSGAGGIEFPGDDPILNLAFAPGRRTVGPLRMLTERFDYGSYRILGLQTNEQGSYPRDEAPFAGIGDIAITVAALSLYNGQELFLQDREQELPSGTFAIVPTSRTQSPNAGGFYAEVPYNYMRRRSRFFMGFRDYPVVSGTANVQILVRAFTTTANPGPGPVGVPFSCNLIAELVEDKVFGDVAIPSPPARPGAMVKVAARGRRLDRQGREYTELVTSRQPLRRKG